MIVLSVSLTYVTFSIINFALHFVQSHSERNTTDHKWQLLKMFKYVQKKLSSILSQEVFTGTCTLNFNKHSSYISFQKVIMQHSQ